MDLVTSFLLLSFSFLGFYFAVKYFGGSGSHLPPGPKGLPILGNILDLHANREEPRHLVYSKWSQKYGDVFTFNVLGSRTVVLNSYQGITELLENRSHNFSDRAPQPMATELAGWSWAFAFMRYSDSWRLHRKIFHQSFQLKMMSGYYDIQRKRIKLLAQKLVASPKNFFQHVRAHAGGIILEISYGYHIQESDDPYVQLADDALIGIRETGVRGTFLVDYVPVLKYVPTWFPGASFKTKAKQWARDANRLRNLPWAFLKQSMIDGTATPSFSTQNLEIHGISPTSNDSSEMEEVIKNCAGIAYMAGADTTVSAILSFILAMVLNPEVQARGQRELDEVIGTAQAPDFADRGKLPYIDAILSETLRWKPVGALPIAHAAVNDDTYKGYLIPGGSTIVPNVWAVLHDESLYGPDTANFNPDRFMKEGKDLPPNPELIAFGFGRRICPGRYLAIDSIWLVITHLLANFTIAREVDNEGKEIDPVVKYTDAFISHPLPFKCRFIPRTEPEVL